MVADSPTSLSNYLDSKQRGVTGAKRGAIKWAINRDVTFGEGETMKKYREVQGCTQRPKCLLALLVTFPVRGTHHNNKQLLDEVEHDIMNYQSRGLCYLPKPKAETDNTDTRV